MRIEFSLAGAAYARDGKPEGGPMGPYSANVIEPIMLFDELVRLGQGDVAGYTRVRAGAWDWFQKYPLAHDVWVGYFEDTVASMGNMNQVIPLEFARYVLLHPDKDPQWREHARHLIEWVKTTPKWPKYIVHGATVTTEQGNGINFCCNLPNQCCDSHTSRLAAVEALFFAKTGEVAYRDAAFRSYNWVTYFQGSAGRRACSLCRAMVVHRPIRRRPKKNDGCVLGSAGVGSGGRIPSARLEFGGDEDQVRQGICHLFDVRSPILRRAPLGFRA